MARKYASAAVEDVAAYTAANLPGCIDTVEAAESVTLADPVAYLRGENGFEERSPVVEVTQESAEPLDLTNQIWFHSVSVAVVLRARDADVIRLQEDLRRYATALLDCYRASVTLGGCAIEAVVTGVDFAAFGERGRLVGAVVVDLEVRRDEL